MTIYEEILNWSNSKPSFIQDALRRIITSTALSENDIIELTQLVRKECGDSSITLNAIPIDNTHIPISIERIDNYPRLKSISNPTNICALHNQGHLTFSSNGLTVVYGNNGSGKSSYSRILRKLCWSRNPSITIKKNVFERTDSLQKVDFVIEANSSNVEFTWTENSPNNTILNSIFVFDNECGDTYINNENPMDYKPVGIDILEKLIVTFGRISQNLEESIISCNTTKPLLPMNLSQTTSARWYSTIENLEFETINTQLDVSEIDLNRKIELTRLTENQNIEQNIEVLTNLRSRVNNYIRQITIIENFFNEDKIIELTDVKKNHDNIKVAYDIAIIELNKLNLLEGFGSNPWRILWEAASKFAHSSNLTDGVNYPSNESLNRCVLCQQELDEIAKQRLVNFNHFVLNDISSKLRLAEEAIFYKREEYNSIIVPPYDNFSELENMIPNFKEKFNQFEISVNRLKNLIDSLLTNNGDIGEPLELLTTYIVDIIKKIDTDIENNRQLSHNRNDLLKELDEIKAKEYLFLNKEPIIQYHKECKFKEWIKDCQSLLNTGVISRKIGELMQNQAVSIQHQEFIAHLNYFNRELASKVQITRTRTQQGNTYQKCILNNIGESMNSVLSEGEQKIVALSNFLAECTIDNRQNSMVFDDPVTSLDMDYRELIAKKIVDLAQNRQIIVFTHDLSFLRLLIDIHKEIYTTDSTVIGIVKYDGTSGIVSDEIPYLAKNVQERIDSIRRILREHDALHLTDIHGREVKLDSARKRFRMLLERSVEEILSNKTFERFNKNIHLKKSNLSSYIITEQTDVDFLLDLFSKYSVTEHDGGTFTIPQLPSKNDILQDLTNYSDWKENFKNRLNVFKANYC